MFRIAGAFLLICGGGLAGAGEAFRLRRRADGLRALADAVGLMARELALRKTPMPELMARMEQSAAEPVRPFFTRVRQGLEHPEGEPFSQLWRKSAGEMLRDVIGGEACLAAAEAGTWLGRYDAAQQAAALERLQRQLDDLVRSTAERAARECRTRTVLGLAAGIAGAVLLL